MIDEPALLECAGPAPEGGGDTASTRGIRFTVDQGFQGARLSMLANVAGSYSFSAELRRSSGFVAAPEVTVPMEVSLATGEAWTSVPIDFGEITVSGSETFTLKLASVSGPGTAYFEVFGVGNTPCPNMEETTSNSGSNPSERGDPNHFTVIAVPEPAQWLGLAGGALLLHLLARRNRPPRGGSPLGLDMTPIPGRRTRTQRNVLP